MNKIWIGVVGKLWVTILLLVSFVLFVFTVLMLEFLQNYHMQQAESSLRQTATTIESIVNDESRARTSDSIIQDILPKDTNAFIAKNTKDVTFAIQEGINKTDIQKTILSNVAFSKIYKSNKPILKEMILPSSTERDMMASYVVLGFPIDAEKSVHSAVFVYQSPEALHNTTKQTTRIVFLSAFIAFVLTTIFAFFLSSRVAAPLSRLREQAFEIAKGNFDAKIQTNQNDEIGQLATAFNQMGRQLKHHVEVINQEKEQLSNILTSMTDSVITFNRDCTILISNPPAERLLQKWFVGKNSKTDSPIPPEFHHMLEHVLNFEDKLEEEIEMDGSYYMLLISPLYSGELVRGAVAVIRDMTEQHRLEKLRSDFIANVSHELRTPIAMLQGYSEAILDEVVTTPEDKNEMIRIIYDESQRMGRLVKDLLDLARMESGHMNLYKQDLPINMVFERITYKFAQVAKEKQVALAYVSEFSDETFIKLDEDRIEQVLTNLIDNAIRHTLENGSVTVHVSMEGTFAKIEVKDTGTGIPKEDLPFVFERFYKADKARTRSKGGTGLGLAIARNIVMAHKGYIQVDSELGVGTTFTFYVPLS